MFAVVSDIHANLEALAAVLADADRHGVERVVCLGDIVGHGPDPVACIDLIRRRCEVTVIGNYDQAAISEPLNFEGFGGALGRRSIIWTRQLDGFAQHHSYLAHLTRSQQDGRTLYVHGSAWNPLNEYVFPEDIYNHRKMERIFEVIPHVCFCGHTHIPGVLLDRAGRYDIKTGTFLPTSGEGEYAYFAREEIGHEWRIDGHKTIINVGSVGQPRDNDPRAGYVLVKGGHVRFRRVHYDVETTIRKIYDIPELENMDGDRLRDGR